jgi:hypothetical protein
MDAPSALDESANRPAQADQLEHGRCGMVNSPLINPARLSTERAVSRKEDFVNTQNGIPYGVLCELGL